MALNCEPVFNSCLIKKDKKNYEKFAEHIGQFPLVVISPLDFFLINEGSDYRRKFLDGMLSQLYPNYLENLVQFNKILLQRNSLLKTRQNLSSIEGLLDVYDFQLAQLGNKILEERLNFLDEFINLCNKIYLVLSGNKEIIALEYQSSFTSNQLENELITTRNKDLQIGYTGIGPHKDDLKFLLNQMPIKKFASQGQQKSFLVSLKLAQYSIFKNHLNIKPILLLDDFHDKLDASRVGRLIDLLNPKDFGQIFITDTDEKKLIHHFEGKVRDFKLFNLENSTVNEVSFKTLM
jgi:DNA replication and repair protein RecF